MTINAANIPGVSSVIVTLMKLIAEAAANTISDTIANDTARTNRATGLALFV